MDLFYKHQLEFEKTSAEVSLPEDPNSWAYEIQQEVFKQVPFVSAYDLHVKMDRVDAERGYGFGVIEVMNKTELQPGTDPKTLDAAGVKVARIPILIKERKLQPFDILITPQSKVVPLTDTRIRQILFRPQMFDLASRTPGDQAMIGTLFPPFRQASGMGGAGGMSIGSKTASYDNLEDHHLEALGITTPKEKEEFKKNWPALKGRMNEKDLGGFHSRFEKADGDRVKKASMLVRILPTINESDFTGFTDRLSSDPKLAMSMAANHGAKIPLEILSGYTPPNAKHAAAVIGNLVPPTVLQVRVLEQGYSIKTANHTCWEVAERVVDRGQLVDLLGAKVALAADSAGSVTIASGAEVGQDDAPEGAKIVDTFGMYRVRDSAGTELVGYVFPELVETDGRKVPIALFTNGSQAALQGEIAGVPVEEGAQLHMGGHPRGYGSFVRESPDGGHEASIPMELQMALTDHNGTSLTGSTYDGRPLKVYVQHGVQQITEVGDGQSIVVPDDYQWMPLDKAGSVVLESDAGMSDKVSSVLKGPSVSIRAFGFESISIDGPAVEKIASEDLRFDEALFLLAGLGVQPTYGIAKIGQALAFRDAVEVKVGRAIRTSEQFAEIIREKTAQTLANIPVLRRDLVKEAAVIPDPTAVDTVLSLGFLNPENERTFAENLPLLDEAQSKMCDLLFAARCGLQNIPIPALERAIRTTEEVIEGLRVIAFPQRNG